MHSTGPSRRELWVLWAVVASVTLPFLNKPFHIDDPFILQVTENILANPLDPFAGVSAWFGTAIPIWQQATNPPLWNYWLAPFAAISDYSEAVLHAAMIPFYGILGWATLWLGHRFTRTPSAAIWVLLFVMWSAGIVVSGNVMRDIPTTALATAAIALMVNGCDRDRAGLLFLGALSAGLALLMKYSAVVLVPLLVLYPLLRGRSRDALWALIPLVLLALWSLHNTFVYGVPHILHIMGRSYGPGSAWVDNLCGVPVVFGSLIYLMPALMWRVAFRSDRVLGWVLGLAALTGFLTWLYLGDQLDPQYLFWSLTGAALLTLCLGEGTRQLLRFGDRDPERNDAVFLAAWLCAPVLFAVLFAPFQAVRHFLPALPPLVLLAFRALEGTSLEGNRLPRALLGLLLAAQAAVAFVVAGADFRHANTYRDFATQVQERWGSEARPTWYVGHWGWAFYGKRAGLEATYAEGPVPRPGDRLVQPQNYYNGSVFSHGDIEPGIFRKIDDVVYPASAGLRPMHPAGAGFYALFAYRDSGGFPLLPYRWLPNYPDEAFEVLERVRPNSREIKKPRKRRRERSRGR